VVYHKCDLCPISCQFHSPCFDFHINFVTYKYFSETWFLSVRDKRKLIVFEIKIPRKVFEPKRVKVTGGQIELCNGLLNDFHSSPVFTGMIKSSRTRVAQGDTCGGKEKSLQGFGVET